jgi:hypothetical protein
MSSFLYNGATGGSAQQSPAPFRAQGTEMAGVGVSQEQVQYGTESTTNSAVSDTPTNILAKQGTPSSIGAAVIIGLQAPTK